MMADTAHLIAENCISEPVDGELERLLEQLTLDQVRFVVARQECATDREAARKIGMSESMIYRWPKVVKDAVRLMAEDGVKTALFVRRRALAKAMLVKTAGLDSRDERVRQSAATEIIEWELGKASQRTELTGADGGPVVIELSELSDDELERIARGEAVAAGAGKRRDRAAQTQAQPDDVSGVAEGDQPDVALGLAAPGVHPTAP